MAVTRESDINNATALAFEIGMCCPKTAQLLFVDVSRRKILLDHDGHGNSYLFWTTVAVFQEREKERRAMLEIRSWDALNLLKTTLNAVTSLLAILDQSACPFQPPQIANQLLAAS